MSDENNNMSKKSHHSNLQIIQNYAYDHIGGVQSSKTATVDKAFRSKNNSNISVMNIKQEDSVQEEESPISDEEKNENDPHAMNSNLVITTESDQRGNKEMLDIIENINDSDERNLSFEKERSTNVAYETFKSSAV